MYEIGDVICTYSTLAMTARVLRTLAEALATRIAAHPAVTAPRPVMAMPRPWTLDAEDDSTMVDIRAVATKRGIRLGKGKKVAALAKLRSAHRPAASGLAVPPHPIVYDDRSRLRRRLRPPTPRRSGASTNAT